MNGLLSFEQPITFNPRPFPISSNELIIAPFWSDIDTRARGMVYYRVTNTSTQIDKAALVIQAAFPDDYHDFVPTCLVIVTWDDVGYYNRGSDLVSRYYKGILVIRLTLY